MGFQGLLPVEVPSVSSLLWELTQVSTAWGDLALPFLEQYLFKCCLAKRLGALVLLISRGFAESMKLCQAGGRGGEGDSVEKLKFEL